MKNALQINATYALGSQEAMSQPMMLEEFSLYTQSCKATNRNVKYNKQMRKHKTQSIKINSLKNSKLLLH
jgi:hypothetical protein